MDRETLSIFEYANDDRHHELMPNKILRLTYPLATISLSVDEELLRK